MKLQQGEGTGQAPVECLADITSTGDALALAYACSDAGTDLLLIHADALPEQFFDLRTGFAGEFVQKLVNARLRTAVVFDPAVLRSARFREYLREARSHPQFRAFDSLEDARAWLDRDR